MGVIDIPTYMIIIKDDPVSEYYASLTLPAWKSSGFNVNRFDACTPNSLPDFTMEFTHLVTYRYVVNNLKKEHTPTEKACWYSHMSLWKKCIDLGRPILVLEHDSYPLHPGLIDIDTDMDFIAYDLYGMGCYIISPKLSKHSWDMFVEQKQPIDIGPYGHIHDILLEKKDLFKCVGIQTENFFPAATQILDSAYGATIDHFGGTEAEPYKETLGVDDRVEYIPGKAIDKNRLIRTIVG